MLRSFTPATLALVLLTGSAPASFAQAVSPEYRAAEAEFQRGHYAAARQILTEILHQRAEGGFLVPRELFAEYLLFAKTCYHSQDYDEAVQYLELLRQIRPRHPEVVYYLGLSYLSRNQVGKSIKEFQKITRNEATRDALPDVHFLLGLAYSQIDAPETALIHFRSFVQLPGADPTYRAKALSYIEAHAGREPAIPPSPPPPAQRSPPPAPAFAQAREFSLADYTGRVVLLHFWASWCEPCRREMPQFTRFYRQEGQALARKGLVMVTVSNDVRESDLVAYASDQGFDFPIVHDDLNRLNDHFEVEGIPATLIFDRDGRILQHLEGIQDWMNGGMASLLDRYLGPR